MRRDAGNRKRSVFERRSHLEKMLAVAEEGEIRPAAERLAICQPALTRAPADCGSEDFAIRRQGSCLREFGRFSPLSALPEWVLSHDCSYIAHFIVAL